MTWTYDVVLLEDPTKGPLYQTRLIVGDTNVDAPLLQDEEINFYVNSESSVWFAAADAAQSIAAKSASKISKSIGELSAQFDQLYQHYDALAKRLRLLAPRMTSVGVYVGGMSRADMQSNVDNPDLNVVDFFIGIDDNRFIGAPSWLNGQWFRAISDWW